MITAGCLFIISDKWIRRGCCTFRDTSCFYGYIFSHLSIIACSSIFLFLLPSPPVQAGCWTLWVEQTPKRQVHGSHGSPLLEYGPQHQSVRLQAVRDDQVRPNNPSLLKCVCGIVSFSPWRWVSPPQVLPPADIKAVPVGKGSFGVSRQRNGAEAEDEGGASPLLHHLRGQATHWEHFSTGGVKSNRISHFWVSRSEELQVLKIPKKSCD